MQEHVHWGITNVLFYAAATIITIKVLELAAAHLVDDPRTETIGKVIAGFLPGVGIVENAN